MKQVKYVGKQPVTILFIDGGTVEGITTGKIVNVPDKDFDSLIELSKETKQFEEVENNG